jgi:hypothetical protein
VFLKVIFIYWPLLSVIIAAALSRLVHNAKVADRALGAQ